ncbi:MAG: redoxin domain-containing protein [Ignavibacteria bacterium]|nr:redoxin domain-containing protein [Ignavibacteria bacterium]
MQFRSICLTLTFFVLVSLLRVAAQAAQRTSSDQHVFLTITAPPNTVWYATIINAEDVVADSMKIDNYSSVVFDRNKTYWISFQRDSHSIRMLVPVFASTADSLFFILNDKSIDQTSSIYVDYFKVSFELQRNIYRLFSGAKALSDIDSLRIRVLDEINLFGTHPLTRTLYGDESAVIDRFLFQPMREMLDIRIRQLVHFKSLINDTRSENVNAFLERLREQTDTSVNRYHTTISEVSSFNLYISISITNYMYYYIVDVIENTYHQNRFDYPLPDVLLALLDRRCLPSIIGVILAEVQDYLGDINRSMNENHPWLSRLDQLLAECKESCCREYRARLNDIIRAWRINVIQTIPGLMPDRSMSSIRLDSAKVYVLHFWGTWCKPCIDQFSEMELVSDSLTKLNVEIIHIDYDDFSRYNIWQKMTPRLSGLHILSGTRGREGNEFINRLKITTFPSYLIVGRGNHVEGRLYRYTHILPAIKSMIESK